MRKEEFINYNNISLTQSEFINLSELYFGGKENKL